MIANLMLPFDGWTWFGIALMWLGAIALIWVLIDTYGGVRVEPEPMPVPDESPTVEITPRVEGPPMYTAMDDWYPLAGHLTAVIDSTTAAVIDLTETVVLRPVDPLGVTAEVEVIDPEVPLYYQIKRPAPYVAEGFTEGIERARIERIKVMGAPK